MNSSVPGAVSPPLIIAAAARMPTITSAIAQNSVVLNACFVSVERRRTPPCLAERSPAPSFPARTVADSMLVPPQWDSVPDRRELGGEPRDLGLGKAPPKESPP